jgi:hypothetical protein
LNSSAESDLRTVRISDSNLIRTFDDLLFTLVDYLK